MAERRQSINDSQIVSRQQDERLPAAGVPNIANYRYLDEPANEIGEEINDVVIQAATLEAPRNLTVVSQTIRFASDGTQYVDVVVEFDEVDGAEGFEARVAKL